MQKQDYINAYWQAACAACAGTKIFPELAIAESAVESAWGESELAKEGNNLFGVKAYPNLWTGKTIVMHTKEFHPDGSPYFIDATFKAYDSPQESFEDYVKVVQGARYQATGVEQAADANAQIEDIAKAGYSTSPTYAALIEQVMRGLQPLLPGLA